MPSGFDSLADFFPSIFAGLLQVVEFFLNFISLALEFLDLMVILDADFSIFLGCFRFEFLNFGIIDLIEL
jgi:hypothetical protein